jgi:hypothetical protein
MTMKFTDTELSTISNALTVARDRFKENAAELRKVMDGLMYGRMAEQFEQQAAQVDAIIERIATEEGL